MLLLWTAKLQTNQSKMDYNLMMGFSHNLSLSILNHKHAFFKMFQKKFPFELSLTLT